LDSNIITAFREQKVDSFGVRYGGTANGDVVVKFVAYVGKRNPWKVRFNGGLQSSYISSRNVSSKSV